MTSRGRKEDRIWQHFVKLKVTGKLGCRAKCKKCNKEMQGLVDRLKNHWEICTNQLSISDTENVLENMPQPSTSQGEETTPRSSQSAKKQKRDNDNASLSSFVVRTSQDKKKEIDKQLARAMFATNCSFRSIEHTEVQKAIEMLRPGYKPPSRFQLSSTLLDEIYEEEKSKSFKKLSGQSLCMSIDGWSNIHNEPIICAALTTEDGNTVLLESVDTSGHPHTAEYLADLAIGFIKKCKNQYNATVTSFVTDNAANMNSARKKIGEALGYPILTFGCSAHILNLLSKDLELRHVKEHVVQIVKYFRNTHLPNAWYKEKGGKKLIVPQDVRWNTVSDCLEVYISEWPKLLQICEEHKDNIDSVIFQKVSNIHIKRMAEDFLKLLKPISVTLDRVQQKGAYLSHAVEAWKKLMAVFDDVENDDTNLHHYQLVKKRYDQALTPFHFLAYLLDPTRNKNEYPLSSEEKKAALDITCKYFPNTGLLPLIIKLEAKSDPFEKTMFSSEILQNVTAVQWWRSQQAIPEINKVLQIIVPILCACSTSSDLERMFSTYGFVHSDVRNRLGNEKAAKLVFLFKQFNI